MNRRMLAPLRPAARILTGSTYALLGFDALREPGVVENARVVAYDAGVAVSVDLMPVTARVRFDGTSA